MKKWMKICFYIIGGVSGILLILGILAIWGVSKLGDSMCGNEIIEEIHSPDNKHKAIIFERNCGATTGFSTQVSILDSKKILKNESGNLFTSDTNHGVAPSGPGGGPKIEVVWKSNNTIAIKHHAGARLFKSEEMFNEINVTYEQY